MRKSVLEFLKNEKLFYIKIKKVKGDTLYFRVKARRYTYTIYNHMFLPTRFEGPLEELYQHLKEHVQVWDAAVQRQIEVNGKDAYKLIQLMTCRDLSKAKVGMLLCSNY